MKVTNKYPVYEAIQLTEELAHDCLKNGKPGPFGLTVFGHWDESRVYNAWVIIGRSDRVEIGKWIIDDDSGWLTQATDAHFKKSFVAI